MIYRSGEYLVLGGVKWGFNIRVRLGFGVLGTMFRAERFSLGLL